MYHEGKFCIISLFIITNYCSHFIYRQNANSEKKREEERIAKMIEKVSLFYFLLQITKLVCIAITILIRSIKCLFCICVNPFIVKETDERAKESFKGRFYFNKQNNCY